MSTAFGFVGFCFAIAFAWLGGTWIEKSLMRSAMAPLEYEHYERLKKENFQLKLENDRLELRDRYLSKFEKMAEVIEQKRQSMDADGLKMGYVQFPVIAGRDYDKKRIDHYDNMLSGLEEKTQ